MNEKVQELMRMLSDMGYGTRYSGCTEAELEAVKNDQQVSCLPEMYRQLVLAGIIGVLDANVMPKGLIDFQIKQVLTEELDEEGIAYPRDIFAFYEHNSGDEILFFRTRDCPDDPPVYGYRGEGYFEKLADSISEIVEGTIEGYMRLRKALTQEQKEPVQPETPLTRYGHQMDYYYNPATDEFYGVPSPSYDEPLPVETVFEMLRTKIERVRSKYGWEFQGCTEMELEDLKLSQNVGCLPDVYRQLMLLTGKEGTGWALDGYGDSEYDRLKDSRAKEVLFSKLDRFGESYPRDIFVFFIHAERSFHFFRTQDCAADPMVFSYRNNFYKLADSFSQFLLHHLDPSISRQQQRIRWMYQQEYIFSVEQDSFVPRATTQP